VTLLNILVKTGITRRVDNARFGINLGITSERCPFLGLYPRVLSTLRIVPFTLLVKEREVFIFHVSLYKGAFCSGIVELLSPVSWPRRVILRVVSSPAISHGSHIP